MKKTILMILIILLAACQQNAEIKQTENQTVSENIEINEPIAKTEKQIVQPPMARLEEKCSFTKGLDCTYFEWNGNGFDLALTNILGSPIKQLGIGIVPEKGVEGKCKEFHTNLTLYKGQADLFTFPCEGIMPGQFKAKMLAIYLTDDAKDEVNLVPGELILNIK